MLRAQVVGDRGVASGRPLVVGPVLEDREEVDERDVGAAVVQLGHARELPGAVELASFHGEPAEGEQVGRGDIPDRTEAASA